MIEFVILAQGLYRPAQVHVSYDPTRRLHVAPETRTWMDSFWQEKLALAKARQSRLFDAPLFRLAKVTEVEHDTENLHILLGDTSYKEYVTTRDPHFARGRSHDELGNPLSVCSVVETSDDVILLDQRRGVDVYEGRYHVIGGFFERHLDMAAVPDPFAAMRREIREETGIQEQDILEQYCLGIVYDQETPHPEMCFLTRLNIPLSEVLTRQPEDDEANLQTLHVTESSLREFILQHHGNISATGEPNLLLYGGWKFGSQWYDDVLGSIV